MTPGELIGEHNFNQFWPGVIAVKDMVVRTVWVPIVPAELFPTLKVPGVAEIGISRPTNDTTGHPRTFCFITPTCILRLPPHHRSVIGNMPEEINPSFIVKILDDLATTPYVITSHLDMTNRLGYNLLFRFSASPDQRPFVRDTGHPDLPDIPTVGMEVKNISVTEETVQAIKRGVRFMNGLCVEQAESTGKGWARPEYPATSNGWEIVW